MRFLGDIFKIFKKKFFRKFENLENIPHKSHFKDINIIIIKMGSYFGAKDSFLFDLDILKGLRQVLWWPEFGNRRCASISFGKNETMGKL